jgi:hypothetical protein
VTDLHRLGARDEGVADLEGTMCSFGGV